MKSFRLYFISSIVFLLALFFVHTSAFAQASNVQCGDIVQGEFTDEYQEQFYNIELSFGDQIMINGVSLEREGLLAFAVVFYEPDQTWIGDSGVDAASTPYFESNLLESRGMHIIKVTNTDIISYGRMQTGRENSGGVGRYALYIRCILRDGTVIEPGQDVSTPNGGSDVSPSASVSANFSGVGFPGLASVDFSNIAELPLPLGTPMSGAITATGGEIIGFQFDASEGDTLDLSFTRISGNLNLGLVVLFADNQVAYQASLVSSSTMNSRFTLPSTDTYTIGLFRIDLLPPQNPQATAFQILAMLNP